MKNEIIFGEIKSNEEYIERKGAYGITINKNEEVGLIKTSTGYFLAGGGNENNESIENCLIREFLEETGYKIEVKRKIGTAKYYFYSTTKYCYMVSIGHFYFVELKNKLNIKTEDDHSFVWLTKEDAITKLFLDNQKWAIKKAFEIKMT